MRRRRRRPLEGVEVTRTIAPDDHVLGAKVLHRETKRIKLNRNKFISSELACRNKFFFIKSGVTRTFLRENV